ncbi:hypothetical protein [Agaribacter marinus]|uniref:PEGA domain-containing protein n=1 Tax=Agaribacter marinus TaxID=1431249 RepID=A0AA37STP0_9ALTE|nr:hypothetical protein [Agaribacter marinus]GLR69238.1 hypothetical protein GCM10007852_01460 [Agaribacter marinus]
MEHQTSTDDKIAERQQVAQARIKKIVWISSGLILSMLLAFAAWQMFTRDSSFSQVPAEQAVETVYADTSDTEDKRAEFMQKMADIEANLLPKLTQADFRHWASDKLLSLESKKNSALAHFAKSQFLLAVNQAEEFDREAKGLLDAWHEAFDDALQQAWLYFNEGKINQARLAYGRANSIKPDAQESELLSSKLASFDRVMRLQQDLHVAEVENNYAKQAEILKDMLALDASLLAAENKLINVQDKLDKQGLSTLLSQADTALQNQQLSKAQALLEQAKSIDAKAAGIQSITAKLQAYRQQKDLEKRTAEINALIQNQEWEKVTQAAKRYRINHPNAQTFIDALAQGENILSQQKRISAITNQPARLEDANIRAIAISRLKEALPFSIYSDALAADLGTLSSLLDKYTAEVEVDVLSDGESYILVLGVGHVGKVQQKTIKLTPGNYTFEARRDGYKTQRISVEIKNNTNNVVEVLSNEKI